jgi:spore coat polysaccharide biosynthesis protein SpsF
MAIVQARMTSTRFPGKVLADLAGGPMILRQLERVSRADCLDLIVVATSDDPSDDVLAATVEQAGFPVIRGSLDDVLGRFITAIDAYEPEIVVRLTADCPLASPAVIDQVVNDFLSTGADYVSNTMTPTFPDGLDVEVVTAQSLRKVDELSIDPPEREHVTLGIYRRPELFTIRNVENSSDLSHLRWTVDTQEDLAFVRDVYADLYQQNPNFDVAEILEYLHVHPERSRTDADAARNAALQGLNTGVMNV